jgi:hypothetical protein
MLAYTCYINAHRAYYRCALDYFDKFIRKDNEDIVLLDVEFKINEVIITFENAETEEQFYRNIPIVEFINYFKNDKDIIKQ